MVFPWIIGGVVAAFGFGLSLRGIVGRGSGGVPRCRGCSQRVTEHQAAHGVQDADQCPECGRSLAGRGITRSRIQRGRVLAGSIVIAAGAGGAALWPSAAWRIASMPTGWVMAVEWPLIDAETRPRLLTELNRRRVAGDLDDAALTVIVDDFVRRLPTGTVDGASFAAWEPLVGHAVAAGLLAEADLISVVRAATASSFTVRPMPPGGYKLQWGVSRQTGTWPVGLPVARVAGSPVLPLTIEPAAVRVDDRLITDADWSWSAYAAGALLPNASGSTRMTRWQDDVITPVAPGQHLVELDLEHRVAGFQWTDTLTATVDVPEWPPPSVVGLDGPELQRRLFEPILVRELTALELVADPVLDVKPPPDGVFADGPEARFLVIEVRFDPSVRQVQNAFGLGLEIELDDGSTRVLPMVSARTGGGSMRGRSTNASPSRSEMTYLRLIHRLEDRTLDGPVRLSEHIGLVLPIARMLIEVDAGALVTPGVSPDAAGAGATVEGWLNATDAGGVRLTAIPVRRSSD